MEFLASFLPERATEIGARIDLLFVALLIFSSILFFVIFFLGAYFAWKYRAGSSAPRKKTPSSHLALEGSWIIGALVISLGFFWWASVLYMDIVRGPAGPTLDVSVEAKQWMWKFEHPSGKREIDELHVPRGERVKLVMTSIDVIHSFFVPAFRLKHDVLPNAVSTLTFIADKNGEFHLFCAEYCGTEHSRMRGRVIVMDPEEYRRWAGLPAEASMASQGAALFKRFACHSCHMNPAGMIGPHLENIYGRAERMKDGTVVIVDEKYIQESIVNPDTKIVAGYENNMPTYKGRLSDDDIKRIIAYIKSLSPGQAAQGASNG